MHPAVPFPFVAPGKAFAAHITGKGFLTGVSAGVCGEMVASAEAPQTDAALERFVSRVDADVPVELIRPREAPVAGLHRTREGFLLGRPG